MGLLNLRNALMTGKRLPYDAEVEYLESTGTQYIDIPVSVSAGQFFEVAGTISAANLVTNAMLFDANVSGQFYSNRYSESSSSIIFASSVGGVSSNGGWSITPNRMTAFALSTTGKTVDGVFTALARPLTSTLSKIRIFGPIGSGFAFASVRFAAIKITVGNDVVFDGIPVRVGTVGYLYDRVSGKLFGNAGTGDFVLGPDVVPVEYIESHETEWIDIPVSGTPDEYFGIKGLIKITNTSQSGYSVWDTNTHRQFGASGYGMASGAYMFASWVGLKNVDGGWSISPGVLYPFEVSTLGRTLLGEFQSLPRNITSTFSTLRLFGKYTSYSKNASVAFGALTITDSVGIEQKLFPVRVGTDATSWEGAMMDTLTRRIYRNAGTGAFTYGNDLKYPIPAE